ncbi:hypothetical protein [Bradyrhizobium sp. CCBAU 53338]|uniref:hypothetical protein n=1 Tax=Bradyrhizobium sp. CCBAU 53338 TaxID=1325111 RepID=UPI00188C39AA|nr:hypothetical protein [Bradyrhizobium sp. CCBAU 53338]
MDGYVAHANIDHDFNLLTVQVRPIRSGPFCRPCGVERTSLRPDRTDAIEVPAK